MRTLLVLTPFSVADILDTRPSGFCALVRISPVHVTIVLAGVVTVLHPRRPADVAACAVGMLWAYSTADAGLIGNATEMMLAMDLVMNPRRSLSPPIFFGVFMLKEMHSLAKQTKSPTVTTLIFISSVCVESELSFYQVADGLDEKRLMLLLMNSFEVASLLFCAPPRQKLRGVCFPVFPFETLA